MIHDQEFLTSFNNPSQKTQIHINPLAKEPKPLKKPLEPYKKPFIFIVYFICFWLLCYKN